MKKIQILFVVLMMAICSSSYAETVTKLSDREFKISDVVPQTTKEMKYDYVKLKYVEKQLQENLAKVQALLAQGEASGIKVVVDTNQPYQEPVKLLEI